MNLFDAVSLVSSIAGLILAVVAMWLSYMFKVEADKVNVETGKLLRKIRTDAKLISKYAMPELEKHNSWLRNFADRSTTSDSTGSSAAHGLHVEFSPGDTPPRS